ncbi:MAG: hypothetical protein ACJA1R_001980 [Flavobacteriales bacterium]|jgi:hypothetical protein
MTSGKDFPAGLSKTFGQDFLPNFQSFVQSPPTSLDTISRVNTIPRPKNTNGMASAETPVLFNNSVPKLTIHLWRQSCR